MAITITLKANSFRKIPTPYEKEGKMIYISTVNIRDIVVDIEDWRDVNVRDPRTKSDVFREILGTLENDIENFIFKNRGMTILAESVTFDNQNNLIRITFSDKNKHGLIDGGHTYQAIREFQNKSPLILGDGYVKIEFLEGIDDTEEIANIIGARNTSRQVQASSLENLLGTFDGIKDVLKNQRYADLIEYSEYDAQMDADSKVNIQEILSYLVCFDVDEYPVSDAHNQHPIFTYSSKTRIVEYFSKVQKAENPQNRMNKLLPLLPDILKLKDLIYRDVIQVYNATTGGKGGALRDVNKDQNIYLPFIDQTSIYEVPKGFIYPILAAFRGVVTKDSETGLMTWEWDIEEFYNEIKAKVITTLVSYAKKIGNPNALGKDTNTWNACLQDVLIYRGYKKQKELEEMIRRLQK